MVCCICGQAYTRVVKSVSERGGLTYRWVFTGVYICMCVCIYIHTYTKGKIYGRK